MPYEMQILTFLTFWQKILTPQSPGNLDANKSAESSKKIKHKLYVQYV